MLPLPWSKQRNANKETTVSNNAAVEDPNAAPAAKKKPPIKTQIDPKDVVLAERRRVESIKVLMDKKDYDAALENLMSDSDADFHYFNQVKGEMLGDQHFEAFSRKHGKLKDFLERPAPVREPGICIWSGVNDFGHPLRCHNKCLYHPIERVADHLGVERPKEMDFCVYHVKFCVDTDNHAIPVKIRTPNDKALCNECFVLQNGGQPRALDRIPGTRRKRGDSDAR